jgi:hypothetical protein
LPDPADRIRAEPRARAKPAPGRNWFARFKPASKRTLAGAALGAMMIGIVVNAVALQHGKRIAPGPQPVAAAAVKPPAPAPTQVASAPAPAAPVAAPEPPRPSPTAVAMAHSAKPAADPIADFLRNQGADKRRLTLAAQGALAKLGFSVKATGALDAATREALAEFQKTHHLPVSTEITAKLVKTLNSAVAAN